MYITFYVYHTYVLFSILCKSLITDYSLITVVLWELRLSGIEIKNIGPCSDLREVGVFTRGGGDLQQNG